MISQGSCILEGNLLKCHILQHSPSITPLTMQKSQAEHSILYNSITGSIGVDVNAILIGAEALKHTLGAEALKHTSRT